ncbi:MAG TPA: lytic murein transglycosylase [Vitreimonas sp.]|uniref:lytic murein transglycosylase n=1 Tax=Vitreimonas sp. TaxID=3069702 RepID=UPI002D6870F6|nr:lytic murein transglycosylase [Vitreimonas sp.]HYD86693.1 lytic murein transglycosylase [Vitreimonas sp.]
MARAVILAAAVSLAIACGPTSVGAQQTPPPPSFQSSGNAAFDAWRDDFARRAVARGRDPAVLARLLRGVSPDERVIELDQRQPEFVSPVWDYVNNRVTERRIDDGRALKAGLGDTLTGVEQRYGVPSGIILGIWGLESNYGDAALNWNAQTALSTLAYEGRRRAQFEGYLLALAEMVERGLASQEQLSSSWAGALGQPQFMPDVYLTTAVDWDGDGHRDIWNNRGDVAASIAHYLQDRGWRRGEPVFDEVRLPNQFDYSLADGTMRSVADWAARGVTRINGEPWAGSENLQAQLWLPAGAQGPALLLHHNFGVIRRYNNSDRYALVVSLLARAMDGRASALVRPWPTQIGSLNREQTLELQTLLNGLGYDAGAVDGLFGSGTRRAVRAFQAAQNLPADGFPTASLLNEVRARAGVATEPEREPRGLDRRGVRELQRTLNRLGYSAGTADGVIGTRTRNAIRAFERARGMEVRGRATDIVLEAARAAL